MTPPGRKRPPQQPQRTGTVPLPADPAQDVAQEIVIEASTPPPDLLEPTLAGPPSPSPGTSRPRPTDLPVPAPARRAHPAGMSDDDDEDEILDYLYQAAGGRFSPDPVLRDLQTLEPAIYFPD